MAAVPSLALDNSYARDLHGFSVPWRPEAAPAPKSLFFNAELAEELGLDLAALSAEAAAALFAGQALPAGSGRSPRRTPGTSSATSPCSATAAPSCWASTDPAGRLVDIQLKGSGRTRFSRGGDGRAALGPMLREYVISEAMAALGIPTTRSLAVVTTGEPVYRETVLQGAILTRVAASHIRVGTFEYSRPAATSSACGRWPTTRSTATTRNWSRPPEVPGVFSRASPTARPR